MENASQRTQESNSTSVDTQNEAEVFAASAAEGAITDSKESAEERADLEALSNAVQQTSVATSESENSELPENDSPSEPERTLTKEEMVEEALNCPCIAAMKDGSCGDAFIAAYRCFLESDTEPKGMDCMDQFTGMQGCMAEHPDEYNLDDDDEDPFSVDTSKTQQSDTASQPVENAAEVGKQNESQSGVASA